MSKSVKCSLCNNEYTHILGTIQVKDDDRGKTQEIVVNQKFSIAANVKYSFRSQGNLHILFSCEEGHYFIKSFDGHKGIVYLDDNLLMNGLTDYLNMIHKNEEWILMEFNYGLLGHIESFFRLQESKERQQQL